ncbi:MAG: J domain-containing protein [Legionella sp.]|uniref:J domain-containing protein n=1 Tax=Legionella sp. TaxID=459 RepID=UPI0028419EB1|nr:J domain-containing protein [Legionella sp.]
MANPKIEQINKADPNDPRAMLGVGPDADLEAVNKAWRKISLEIHPDRNLDEHQQATEATQKLNNARDFIKAELEKLEKANTTPLENTSSAPLAITDGPTEKPEAVDEAALTPQDQYDEVIKKLKDKFAADESATLTSDEFDEATKAHNAANTFAAEVLEEKYSQLDQQYTEAQSKYEAKRDELETDYNGKMDDLQTRWAGGEGDMTYDEYRAEHEQINTQYNSDREENSEEFQKSQSEHSAAQDKAYNDYVQTCQANDQKHLELSQQWDKQIAAEKEAGAKDDKEEKKGNAEGANESIGPPKEQDKDKKKNKDPLMELVDELNDFVKQTNQQITDFFKDKASDAWDKLKNTGPMKTLAGALDEAKQFAKDKAGGAWDKLSDSEAANALSSAKDKVSALKEKIGDAFSQAMNSAANAIASGVHNAVTPAKKETDQPQLQAPSDGATTNPVAESRISNADPKGTIAQGNMLTAPNPSPETPNVRTGPAKP